eukprot:g896.t1
MSKKNNKRKADEMDEEDFSEPKFTKTIFISNEELGNKSLSSYLDITAPSDISGTSAADVVDKLIMGFDLWRSFYFDVLKSKKAKKSNSAAGDKTPIYAGQTILDFYQGKETMHFVLPEIKEYVVQGDMPIPPDAHLTLICEKIRYSASEMVSLSPALIETNPLVARRLFVMFNEFYKSCGSPTGTDLVHFFNIPDDEEHIIKLFRSNRLTFHKYTWTSIQAVFDVEAEIEGDELQVVRKKSSSSKKRRKISPQKKAIMEEKVVVIPRKKPKKKEVPKGNTFKEYYDACAKAKEKWAMTAADGTPFYELRSFYDTFKKRRAAWYLENTGKVPHFKKDTFDEHQVPLTPEEKEKRYREKKERKKKRRKNKQAEQ